MECNNCILTTGLLQNCDNKSLSGNNTTMYIIDNCKIDSYTYSGGYYANAVVDDIILKDVSDEWYSVQVYNESLQTTETISNIQNKAYLQTVTFIISHFGGDMDKELAAMESNQFINELLNSAGLTLIIQDTNGINRVFGLDTGLKVTEITKDSGVAEADLSGTTITMARTTGNLAPVISKTFVDNIVPGN